jgi:hypothetical protein
MATLRCGFGEIGLPISEPRLSPPVLHVGPLDTNSSSSKFGILAEQG